MHGAEKLAGGSTPPPSTHTLGTDIIGLYGGAVLSVLLYKQILSCGIFCILMSLLYSTVPVLSCEF